MTFKVIETQEQLDEVIKERIERAKKSVAEGYADYEDLKKAKSGLEKQVADLTEQAKKKDEQDKENEQILADLKAQVHEYEMSSAKTKIALEEGLPFELANKLTGEDEDAIRADAQNMAKFVQQKQTAPIGSPEPASDADPKTAAWMSLSKELMED